jgi:hypothetical protein
MLGLAEDEGGTNFEIVDRISKRMASEIKWVKKIRCEEPVAEPTWRHIMLFSWMKWRGVDAPSNLLMDKTWQELFQFGLDCYAKDQSEEKLLVPSKFFVAVHQSDREISESLFESARNVLGEAFPELPADPEPEPEEASEENEGGGEEQSEDADEKSDTKEE